MRLAKPMPDSAFRFENILLLTAILFAVISIGLVMANLLFASTS